MHRLKDERGDVSYRLKSRSNRLLITLVSTDMPKTKNSPQNIFPLKKRNTRRYGYKTPLGPSTS